ncbi:MAG: hypothetical protein KF883_00180 [Thermomicrobiales bacterium]|nr:hypothetical protein [Thermomicrobiales bacterium]
MPIGWASDGGERPASPAREPERFTWAERVKAAAQQIIHNLTGLDSPGRDLIPTVWTRWETAIDDRVCQTCAPYAGRAWPAADGPHPPLHPGCRCQRRVAYVTWAVRN